MNNRKHKSKRQFKSKFKAKNKSNKGNEYKKKSEYKKDVVEVKCIGMDEQGKGIVVYRNEEVTVPYLLKGETADIEICKNGRNIEGNIVKIKEKSKYRVTPKCPYYNKCGGCQIQHMSYDGQLEFKQKSVEQVMKPFGKVNKIIGMKDPYYYRNKAYATYAYSKNKQIVSGFYEENSHRIIPVKKCIIQHTKADEINTSIRDLMKSFKMRPYDEDRNEGFLRHVLVKVGFSTNEVMVVLVTSTIIFPSKKNFVKALLKKHPEITTIVMNINNRKTSMVLGDREKVLYGKGTIKDDLCDCTFNISSKSFYQVNPIQTQILYDTAIDMADFNGNEVVMDAYSGIGTIGLIVSKNVKSVIGVELNKAAVKDAIMNAKINNIKNAYFYEGDAGDFMVRMAENREKLDVVIMDPPRTGSNEKFLTSVVKIRPKKIIYISCNHITQARDLKILTKYGYKVEEIQPVDMFPQTGHVEVVTLLTRNEKTQ